MRAVAVRSQMVVDSVAAYRNPLSSASSVGRCSMVPLLTHVGQRCTRPHLEGVGCSYECVIAARSAVFGERDVVRAVG